MDKPPEKIISLSPAITEMLFLLHAEDKLIGISDYCNYPEATQNIRRVGGLQNINIETILSMQPDVVLIGSIISKNEVEKLEKSGIIVIAIKEEKRLEGMLEALDLLGKIVDQPTCADSLVSCFRERLDFYNKEVLRVQRAQRPSVYYVVSFGVAGDYTAPANSHINEIIELAGGRNIGDTLTHWNISREYLFSQNPDFIFVRAEELTFFVKTYPYTLLKAVKENRVFPVESGWMDIVSPRNFLAIEEIKSRIVYRNKVRLAPTKYYYIGFQTGCGY